MPDQVHVLHDNLVGAAPSCDCDCGGVSGATCAPFTLHERVESCEDEDFFPTQLAVPRGACVELRNSAISWIHDTDELPQVSGGDCDPIDDSDIPPVAWTDTFLTCEAANSGGCEDDGTCVPGDVDTPICISQPGNLECPAGPWTERTLVFQNFEDDRACTQCTCGEPTGPCGGGFIFWNDSNGGCNTGLLGIYEAGNVCIDEPNATHVQLDTNHLDASCAPSGGDPVGSADPIDPLTLCCLP
jgi:hypothetical protein